MMAKQKPPPALPYKHYYTEGVTSIGENAFAWCKKLKSISLPKSLVLIKKDAFEGCEQLTTVTLHDGLTSIEYGAFDWCKRLMSITIPASVTFIDNAFAFSHPTICTPAGSYAEQFAKEHELKVKTI